MSGIDETKGAGSTSTTNRTSRRDAAGEAGASEEAGQTESTSGGKIPDKSSNVKEYRGEVLGPDGRLGPKVPGGDGEVSSAFLMQAEQKADRQRMAERKKQLGTALDAQYETMGCEWKSEDGFLGVGGKDVAKWKDQYSDYNLRSEKARESRSLLKSTLVRNERPMSKSDIKEVVADHRGRLAERGAFEGWDKSEIDTWETALTEHLTQARDKERVREFDPGTAEGLPTPSRNLGERSVENPDEIRRKVENWKSEQLKKLDKLAENAGFDDPDPNALDETEAAYALERERIEEAADAYIKIMVGDEDGNEYAYPTEADARIGKSNPRDAYIRQLEENSGDLYDAFRAAERRLEVDNFNEAALKAAPT